MRPLLSGQLKEAGIDYITVTCAEPAHIESARAIALSLAEVELSFDMLGKPWHASGYEGFTVGHVTYGERYDGCLVRLGSHVADAHWKRLFHVADHVTRIDVQATFQCDGKPSDVVHRHYGELLRSRRRVKRGPEVSRSTDSRGGYTCYSGVRSSSWFLRGYNKEAQSKQPHYVGCVRYEAQFNKRLALQVATHYLGERITPVEIAGDVLALFRKRGCQVEPLQDEINRVSSALVLTQRRSKSDIAKRCAWLSHSVRPTIKLLLDRDMHELIGQALGLSVNRTQMLDDGPIPETTSFGGSNATTTTHNNFRDSVWANVPERDSRCR